MKVHQWLWLFCRSRVHDPLRVQGPWTERQATTQPDFRADAAPDHLQGRQEDRKERGGSDGVAVAQKDVALRLLPVLFEDGRRRPGEIPQLLHLLAQVREDFTHCDFFFVSVSISNNSTRQTRWDAKWLERKLNEPILMFF